jgi:hypothetical protein
MAEWQDQPEAAGRAPLSGRIAGAMERTGIADRPAKVGMYSEACGSDSARLRPHAPAARPAVGRPTNGLDPAGIRDLIDLREALTRTTVFLSATC